MSVLAAGNTRFQDYVLNPWFAVFLAALLYAATSALWWDRTWDDMAITLGFARTFAETGLFAPTPLSDPVEGTSSLLWMLINAAIAKLHLSPAMLYVEAKLLAIVFLLLDVALVFALGVTSGVSRPSAFIVSLAFAGCEAATIESINGMENPLFLFLYGIAFLSFLKPEARFSSVAFLVSTSLVIFVRWEGIWFLLPFVLINWWRFGLKGLFAIRHWLWFLLFAGQTAWRYVTFGSLIPNTVQAKMQPPYSHASFDGLGDFIFQLISNLRHELSQISPFILVVAGAIIIGSLVWLWRHRKGLPAIGEFLNAISWPVRLLFAIVVAGSIFAMATATIWGYPGRMFFVALPFLLVLLVWTVERIAAANRIPKAPVVLIVAAATFLSIGKGVRNAYAYLDRNTITVDELAQFLPALDAVKRLTAHRTLSVAHPDLGALMLYGRGLRIVDTALLCNRTLAQEGYEVFENEIFGRQKPDVLQTHGTWTKVAGIAAMASLYDDYVPVFVHGIRLFMRRELLAEIPSGILQRREFSPDGRTDAFDPDLLWTRHLRPLDFEIDRHFGYYWVLADDTRQ